MTEPAQARPRADSRRNRLRILEAAREALTARGFELPMEEVADRAGVSVATLYRHFPSKSHLVAELVTERFTEFASELELACQQVDAGREPLEALVAAIWRCAETAAKDRSLQDAIVLGSAEIEAMTADAVERLHDPAERLLRAAIADGSVAPDITVTDLDFLMLGVTASQRPGFRPGALSDWRRHMQLSLRGIRAGSRATLRG